MSLINRMLRDLDRRSASASEHGMLPLPVRPLPDAGASDARRLGAFLALLGSIAAAALAAWAWNAPPAASRVALVEPGDAVQPAPPRVAAKPVAVATMEPTPVARAASAQHENFRDAPVPRPSVEPRAIERLPAATVAGEAREPGLRFATWLDIAAGAAPRPETPLTEAVPAPQAPEARIEKRVRDTDARARAEQEYRRAQSAEEAGSNSLAAQAYAAALREDPAHVPARLALARSLSERGKAEEALAVLREGLSREPREPRLALAGARLLGERGEAERALEFIDQAGARNSAEAHGLKGALLQRLGRHEEAAGEYQAALRLAPTAGVWWAGLGICLEQLGRPAEAKHALQQALTDGRLPTDLAAFADARLKSLR